MKEFILSKVTLIRQSGYIVLLALLTLLLAIAIIKYAEAFEIFTIEKFRIQGNETVASEELFKLSGLQFGDNIFDADTRRAAERIQNNPFIKRVIVSRDMPNTISLRVVERTPFAFLALNDLYGTDSEGYLLPSRSHKNFDLPIITGIDEVDLPPFGEKVEDKRVQKALKVVRLLREGPLPLYNNISEIKISPRGEIDLIGTKKGTRIYLGRSDYERKIERVRSLISTVKPSGGLAKYHYLDLRFKNQVIVKERS